LSRHFIRKFSNIVVVSILAAIVALLAPLASFAQARDRSELNGASSMESAAPKFLAAAPQVLRHPDTKKFRDLPTDNGSVVFPPPLFFSSGGGFLGKVVVADVNGDGKPDLVLTNGGGATEGSVGVLLGNGDGTFQPVVLYDSGGIGAKSLAVADLDGDGKLDVIVANQYPAGRYGQEVDGVVSILKGNGDGTFRPAVLYDSGGQEAVSVVVADVNRDGKLDVLVVNTCLAAACATHGHGGVGVMLGNGDGTLQPAVIYDADGIGSASIALDDLNGDGKIDLLVANSGNVDGIFWNHGSIAVLLGNGDGTFQGAVTYDQGGNFPYAAAIADVNGDGHPDLLVVDSCWCGADSSLAVLLGNGDGTFQSPAIYDSGGQDAISIAVDDLNGDGIPDLVVGNTCVDQECSEASTGVFVGNGDGTFQNVVLYSSGLWTYSVAVSDVNGDNRPDLISGDNSAVAVFLNNTGSSDATTTSLVSALNPSVFGQSVKFTAKVNSSSGTPDGIVIFNSPSAQLGYPTLAHGIASLSTTSLPAGAQSITASYLGSKTFVFSTSATLNQVVETATTNTAIVSSSNPGPVKHSIAYTATVIGQYGGAATGSVQFKDGGTTVATVGLSNNQAVYRKLYKAVGVHYITATYSGDGNNGGSTSGTLTEDIVGPTTTVLTTSGSPSVFGQAVTFTATVSSIYGAIPDGEVVTFYDGSKIIGTGITAGSVAGYTTSSLSVKTHTIRASYAGDSTFKSSKGTVMQVVNQTEAVERIGPSPSPAQRGVAPVAQSPKAGSPLMSTNCGSSVKISSSGSPSLITDPVTFTGDVDMSTHCKGQFSPVCNGDVTFYDGKTQIESVMVDDKCEANSVQHLSAGKHRITGVYQPQLRGWRQSSAYLIQIVDKYPTIITLASSPNPSTFGEDVTLTVTVTTDEQDVPTGRVKFTNGTTTIGLATLDGNGVATLRKGKLPVGSNLITAEYLSDSTYASSTSAVLNQVVNP
jgi:Bacterial Ig-like domain (group 3)/FG-GAP-like repeat